MYYIGIDLGGTNIAVGLLNEQCKILAKKSGPTGASRDVGEIIRDMAELSTALLAEQGIDKSAVHSVGIGSPGTIDDKNGVIVWANNISFRQTPVAEMFRKIWDVPVYLGNDANCAALGEAYAGAAAGCDNAVMITLGTGLGGGIIINKKIYSGFNGAGGELGHMVIQKDGAPCTCGRSGCWESYSSATGLIRMTGEYMRSCPDSILWTYHDDKIENISGKSAFDAAREGDECGKAIVAAYIDYLAAGVANILNIFQPEVLCIGGGVSKEGDNLIKPLSEALWGEVYTKSIARTELKTAILGNDAGIVGAAMLGRA